MFPLTGIPCDSSTSWSTSLTMILYYIGFILLVWKDPTSEIRRGSRSALSTRPPRQLNFSLLRQLVPQFLLCSGNLRCEWSRSLHEVQWLFPRLSAHSQCTSFPVLWKSPADPACRQVFGAGALGVIDFPPLPPADFRCLLQSALPRGG